MRLLRERGEILKYWLITETIWRSRKKVQPHGIAAIVSDDFAGLICIEALRSRQNLTPWIRRKGSAPVDVRIKLRTSAISQLSAAELRPFIEAARQARGTVTEVSVHAVNDRYVLHAAAEDGLSALVIKRELPALRKQLRVFRQIFGSYRLTMIAATPRELCDAYKMKLASAITLQGEGVNQRSFRRAREIRDVLVLTNISGPALPMLDANLAFWSKGITGFRFRHVYGQLTRRRVEAALESRDWHLIVYRGHGSSGKGRFCLNLSDGIWPISTMGPALYLHSACLAEPRDLALENLPAKNILTPLEYLPDFDDAALMELLLGRYKATGSLAAALRAVQLRYPQFVWLATGS